MTTQHNDNDEINPIMQAEQYPGRQRRSRERPTGTPRTCITVRDIEILRSIGRARVMTAQAVEWLHWREGRKGDRGGYHTRLKAAIEANAPHPPAPLAVVHHRLAGLVEYGYLHRITRTGSTAPGTYTRLPDAYSLTAAGREYLHSLAMDMTPSPGIIIGGEVISPPTTTPEPFVVTASDRAWQGIEHAVAIGQFYAALRTMVERRGTGAELAGWQCDAMLARAYDTLDNPSLTGPRTIPIIPDATFTLAGVRYFLEIERATNNGTDLARKLTAYERYRHSAKLRERYGVNNFVVLLVGRSRAHMHSLADKVAATIAGGRDQTQTTGRVEAGKTWWRSSAAMPVTGWRLSYMGASSHWYDSVLYPNTIRQMWQIITGLEIRDYLSSTPNPKTQQKDHLREYQIRADAHPLIS